MNTYEELVKRPNVVKSLLPLNLRYNHRESWLYNQSYYDDPEGVNLLGKLVAANKLALIPGTFLAWADIWIGSKPTGYQKILGRFPYWNYPFLASASLFTVTTFAATRIRNTDDTWNYILGAFAAGAGVGMWKQCVVSGWGYGFVFALAAIAKRISMDEGWDFFPEMLHEPAELRSHKHDYTLFTSSIPKGYDIVQKQ